MMKCVIINCFNNYNYDIRVKPIEAFLIEKGYKCEYITSDFNHVTKSRNIFNRTKSIQSKVLPYHKNLSVR